MSAAHVDVPCMAAWVSSILILSLDTTPAYLEDSGSGVL